MTWGWGARVVRGVLRIVGAAAWVQGAERLDVLRVAHEVEHGTFRAETGRDR